MRRLAYPLRIGNQHTPDRPDADGGGTGQFLGPAREIQAPRPIDIGELRFPEAALRVMQYIDASLDQRRQPLGLKRISAVMCVPPQAAT